MAKKDKAVETPEAPKAPRKVKPYSDGDICRAKVIGKHSLSVNDKGTHVLAFPCLIDAKAADPENVPVNLRPSDDDPEASAWTELEKPIKRVIIVYISKKSKAMATKNLKAMGFTGEKLTVKDINPKDPGCFDFTDQTFLTKVKEDEKYGTKFEVCTRSGFAPSAESLSQLDNLLSEEEDDNDPFSVIE